MRNCLIERKTNETDIKLFIDLDGNGQGKVDTGCGFFNHMMELFLVHSNFNGEIFCRGDIQVDYHHTVEDIGIALGQAFLKALGDKKGITRYADIILPMDETLIMCAVDISGRGYLNYDVPIESAKVTDDGEVKQKAVGDFDTELIEEFFIAFARESKVTLHFKKLYGKNTHHIIEGVFKAFARVLRKAVKIDQDNKDAVPSSKGVL